MTFDHLRIPYNYQGRLNRAFILSLLFISVFILATGSGIFAQEKAEVITSEKCDTAEVDNFIVRSRQLVETHDDSVYYYINRALQQSYHCNFNERIITSLTEMATWYFGHNTDYSIRFAKMAINEMEKRNLDIKKNQIIYKAYNVLAKAYETRGVIDSSAYYYYLLNDVITTGVITTPEYAVAVYSQLALFWLNNNQDINRGDIEQTRAFISKSKSYEDQLRDSSKQSYMSYMLQGAYYSTIEKYDSARYYYLEFLRLREKIGQSNVTWTAAMYLNVADSYIEENKNEDAIRYIKQTQALKEKLAGNPRYILMASVLLAKAYYQQKNYAASISAFETALFNSSKNIVLGKALIDAYKIAGDSYEAMGIPSKALEYKNVYIQLHDSIMKKDKLDMVNRLDMKFRVAEKDKQLTVQKLNLAENKSNIRRKNFLIAGISVITIFLAILFALWQRTNRHKQHLQQEEINNFAQKMEITNLNATISGEEKERARIARELHDGIGGLLAAAKINFELVKTNYRLENENDFTDGLNLLKDASVELRKTAHNMMPEILLQEGLVEAVSYFCGIVGRNSATSIHFQTSGAIRKLPPNFELAIYRVIQELVHNILKHARATEALIQIGFSDDTFDLSIEDNGIGIPEDILEKTKGIGLKSIFDRVKALNGKMTIDNLKDAGTSIYVEISLRQENITTL